MKFRFPVMLRVNKPYIFRQLMMFGYEPEYLSKMEYNTQGQNIVCEYDRFHATDSDNKPHCIDCGTNECMFLSLAMIKTTDVPFITTDGFFIAANEKALPTGAEPATKEEIINYFLKDDNRYKEFRGFATRRENIPIYFQFLCGSVGIDC